MKKIGIGYENYKDFIDNDLYYVDKTLLIRDVIHKGGQVTLFTRPRRFGKTLAMSTIRTFFELEYDREGNVVDNGRYFTGKKVMDAGDDILSRMGRHPVINLSLKSSKQADFYTSFMALRDAIIDEFDRHVYLSSSEKLTDKERMNYNSLLMGAEKWREKEEKFNSESERENELKREVGKYSTSIMALSKCLYSHHGTKVVILVDEYDVPLENAYYKGFYAEMVGFIRSLFESALKTNDALEFAVITGCLRISKESIFTGLNNLKINTVLDDDFSEGFGFTPSETEDMLCSYGLEKYIDEVRQWYDGYLFGSQEVYNPWSVISYVDGKVNGKLKFPRPYWSNTSSNSIIKDLVYNAGEAEREDLDRLVNWGVIEKRIHEDITYDGIHDNEDNLWNFLFFTGYMRKVSERRNDENIYLTMRIPNLEIRYIYVNQLMDWFDNAIKDAGRDDLYRAIREKDCEGIETFLSALLRKSISVLDSAESFYHGVLLSLLYGMPLYSARSNREEGTGRPDIVLYPERPKDPAYIFEIKVRKKFNEMQDGIDEALQQIDDMQYEKGILDDGYAGAVSFGVCFCKKSCLVGLKA